MVKIKKYLIYISTFIFLIFSVQLSIKCFKIIYNYLGIFHRLSYNETYNGLYMIDGTPHKTTNNNYKNVMDNYKKETSELISIFPLSIDDDYNVFFEKHYEYINCEEGLLWGPYYDDVNITELYLYCNYDEISFNNEIDRLKTLKYKKNKIIYSKNLFKYPSYVSIYNRNHKFEYALIDESNLSIYYIYLSSVSKNNIVFDEDLLPKKYIINSDVPSYKIKNGGFSIYD